DLKEVGRAACIAREEDEQLVAPGGHADPRKGTRDRVGAVNGASCPRRYRSNRNWMRNWRYSELYSDPKKGDEMLACTSVGRNALSALSARTPTHGRNFSSLIRRSMPSSRRM